MRKMATEGKVADDTEVGFEKASYDETLKEMESEASTAATKTDNGNKDPAWRYVRLVNPNSRNDVASKASAKTLDKLPDYEDVVTLGDDEDEDDVGTILGGSKGK
ncbi:hypothetical protein GH714_021541 [Hevea brasiliensis]|uniref:Uncharacterized protein n=1 Tax=Hevea brasiliensis TaxID=3981 RepID=A0A6A6KW24_HEVBR|nr:hypothetical protein GH714_021541 [Hevea brasiliensis]